MHKMLCPHCDQEHPASSRYCPTSGAPLNWALPACPSCGREVRPGARFCAACGATVPPEIHRPAVEATRPSRRARAAPPPTPPSAGLPPAAMPPAVNPPSTENPAVETRTAGPADENPGNGNPKLSWVAVPTRPRPETEGGAGRRRLRNGIYLLAALLLVLMVGSFVYMGGRLNPTAGTAIAQATETGVALLAGSGTQTAGALEAANRKATVVVDMTRTPWQSSPTPSLPAPTATTAPTLAAVVPTDTAAPTATPEAAARYGLAFYSNLDNEDGIYLMDPDHPDDSTRLTAPAEYELLAWPTFCGDLLAFEAADRSQNLPTWVFTQPLAGGQPSPVALPGEAPRRITQPGCSGDGRYMAFTTLREGRRSLSLLDREQNTIIGEEPAGGYSSLGYAAWLPAEELLLWMGVRSTGYFDIVQTANFAGDPSGPTRVVAQGKYPAISPDGTRLVYFCGNLLHLCMVERETGELLFQIPVSYFKKIDKKAVPATAAWSGDGKWVYFSSSILGNWDIYRMRPDGSQVRNLTEGWTSDEYMPAAR